MLDYLNAHLIPTEFPCKTVKRVDTSACNVILIEFTDGDSIAIDAHGGYEIVREEQ